MSKIIIELSKLCEFLELCQSLDKMQCFLSQNASVLCEGIECENAVNLSMNCNSIDLNSCKISDHQLKQSNTQILFKCDFNTCNKMYRKIANLIEHKNSVH